jgi:hypothetical protein
MKTTNVRVHIEELVLHGFAPSDRRGIADAVERELTRSFAGQGVPPSLMRTAVIGRLEGGSFDVEPGAKADQIGGQVAQAVFGGLNR